MVQALLLASLAALPAAIACAQRVTVPLNGSWAVGDSFDPDIRPSVFDHTVEVPGLVHSAKPAVGPTCEENTQVSKLGPPTQSVEFAAYFRQRGIMGPAAHPRG
jgi:hypothetical protein